MENGSQAAGNKRQWEGMLDCNEDFTISGDSLDFHCLNNRFGISGGQNRRGDKFLFSIWVVEFGISTKKKFLKGVL